jgi:NAD(P)H-nitrite reductase large subunit
MHPDDEVCLCFHVSLRKICGYLDRENPPVASLISDCLGAGTGCGWCVPFLKHLHQEHQAGHSPDLRVSPEQYAKHRLTYHRTNKRELNPPEISQSDGSNPDGPRP